MRFLADESCDFTAVRALRDAGHDVLAVAEAAGGADDSEVLALATGEKRVLLTEDKDFGQLARAGAKKLGGVVLLRYPHVARASTVAALVRLATEQGGGTAPAFRGGRTRPGPHQSLTLQGNRLRNRPQSRRRLLPTNLRQSPASGAARNNPRAWGGAAPDSRVRCRRRGQQPCP